MTFTELTDAELAQVIADPQQARSILWRLPTGDGPSGSVDKAIDGIQFLLSAADVPIAIAPQQMPGEPIPTQNGEIYFGLSADQVAAIATQLAPTRFAWASRRAIHRHEHLPVRLIAAWTRRRDVKRCPWSIAPRAWTLCCDR
ncbi:DUF1877 family protein [Mycobacterium avium]|uniref:DUF1877 domain-containing protein n=1 Tax=Mycobacterium avium subsp. hominissuis TaxID=439334 RepID=A0A3B6XA02_MYCAV|nr:DUF1877 family protein [Mycobacterium avium]AXO23492.1 DUF1877 domain-containing protein [Mycobacterium avium subsp. hominissuis]PBA72109.1 DUF1877 domain-containing protein [Mycobacterium avium]